MTLVSGTFPLVRRRFGASGDSELFTVLIPAVTPQGLSLGTFEILGGGDGNAQEVLGDATFDSTSDAGAIQSFASKHWTVRFGES